MTVPEMIDKILHTLRHSWDSGYILMLIMVWAQMTGLAVFSWHFQPDGRHLFESRPFHDHNHDMFFGYGMIISWIVLFLMIHWFIAEMKREKYAVMASYYLATAIAFYYHFVYVAQ